MDLSTIIHKISKKQNYIINASHIWDGRSDQLSPAAGIHISGGIITRLGPVIKSEAGTTIIDGEGLVVMPGLIDCHVHLALDGVDFAAATARWENADSLNKHLEACLSTYLAKGILTVRDGGDRVNAALKVSHKIGQHCFPGPLVLASGQAIRRNSKYGSFLGDGITDLKGTELLVRKLVSSGVSQIKVLVSGIVSFSEYGKVGSLQFSDGELAQLANVAHGYGLQLVAHASSDEAVRQCISAGVDSVEHGYFVSKLSLEALAQAGIPWTPTIVPVANQVLKDNLRQGYSPAQIAVIERTYQEHQQKLGLADHLGVQLLTGTDAGAAGVLHASSLAEEMQLFAQAGLPTPTILRSVTSTAAKALALDRWLGTIAPGKLPALVGVQGNPFADGNFTSRIKFVCLPDFQAVKTTAFASSSTT